MQDLQSISLWDLDWQTGQMIVQGKQRNTNKGQGDKVWYQKSACKTNRYRKKNC